MRNKRFNKTINKRQNCLYIKIFYLVLIKIFMADANDIFTIQLHRRVSFSNCTGMMGAHLACFVHIPL